MLTEHAHIAGQVPRRGGTTSLRARMRDDAARPRCGAERLGAGVSA